MCSQELPLRATSVSLHSEQEWLSVKSSYTYILHVLHVYTCSEGSYTHNIIHSTNIYCTCTCTYTHLHVHVHVHVGEGSDHAGIITGGVIGAVVAVLTSITVIVVLFNRKKVRPYTCTCIHACIYMYMYTCIYMYVYVITPFGVVLPVYPPDSPRARIFIAW